MRFGEAIELAHIGKKIARHGWNGKGMYVYLTEGCGIPTDNIKLEGADMNAAYPKVVK